MAELIDRQAALALQYWAGSGGVRYGVVDSADIELLPTVDAVEVVRCRDCKYWAHGDCYRIELSRPNDFCSYGERREDNGSTQI